MCVSQRVRNSIKLFKGCGINTASKRKLKSNISYTVIESTHFEHVVLLFQLSCKC